METLEQIKQEVMQNELITRMYPDAQVVFGYGSGTNGIMIIGEAPSRYGGNITGEPFTSPHSGALLQEILNENNIKKEECFVTNIVFCSPPNNNTPSFVEAMLCLPYIRRIIKVLNPKVVILLGRMPADLFLTSGYARGNPYIIDNVKYIAMYHPAYILRSGNNSLIEYKATFKKIFMEVQK